ADVVPAVGAGEGESFAEVLPHAPRTLGRGVQVGLRHHPHQGLMGVVERPQDLREWRVAGGATGPRLEQRGVALRQFGSRCYARPLRSEERRVGKECRARWWVEE